MADLEKNYNKQRILFPMLVKKDQLKDAPGRFSNKNVLSVRKLRLANKYDLGSKSTLPTLPKIQANVTSLPIPDIAFFDQRQRTKTLVIEIPREQPENTTTRSLKLETSDPTKSSMNTFGSSVAVGVSDAEHKAALSSNRTNTSISLLLNGSGGPDTHKANKPAPTKRNKVNNSDVDVNSHPSHEQDLQVVSWERSHRDDKTLDEVEERVETKMLKRSMTEISDKQDVSRVYGEHNNRLPHKLGSFEKLRDKQVYKRTRILLKSERELKDWPAALELSGKSVVDEEPSEKEAQPSEENNQKVDDPLGFDLSALRLNLAKTSPRSGNSQYSSSYLSDFGLRALRSDLFSGHKKKRKPRSANDQTMENELKKTAHRHIYACQVMSSIRKGSKAARGWSSLMETIGPAGSRGHSLTHSHANSSPTPRYHQRPVINSPEKFFNDKKHSQIALFIKTRENTDILRTPTQKHRNLPGISGRTMVFTQGNK